MSIRPPSLQSQYDDFFSGDPALIPEPKLAADADEKAIAAYKLACDEYLTKLRVARETGDWTAILVGTEQPTKFVMKQISGDAYRGLLDMHRAEKVGPGKANQLAFRCAITKVVDSGLPEASTKVTAFNHPDLGKIASVAISDYFDSIDTRIVSELGGEAMRRVSIGPKS